MKSLAGSSSMPTLETSPAEPPPYPGLLGGSTIEHRTIAGKYRILRVLGSGGMGVVFLAEQLPLRRLIALKLLLYANEDDGEMIRRAVREAQSLAAVEHEAIVRVLDVGQTDTGEIYIALEYLAGLTLQQLLARHGPLPWRWTVRAMAQVLDALAILHERSLVHRDIKPSNCFCVTAAQALESEPRIKLIDFGIARPLRPRAEDAITVDGAAVGTPAYAAPEQMLVAGPNELADLYCVGVTLYELLTARLPIASRAVGGETGAPRPPSEVNPAGGIPEALDRIILRAIEFNPEKRFPSAHAMRQALEELARGDSEPSTDPVAVPTEPFPPSFARHKTRPTDIQPISSIRDSETRANRQLARLHAKVRGYWIEGVLHSSLNLAATVPQIRTREDAWTTGFDAVLESAPPTPIPSHVSMLDVFDQSSSSLLLLGEPGTGKTTQLLMLAKSLLDRGAVPLPVVFTLATWRGGEQPILAWMADELASKYQVPRSFAEVWLKEGFILPLFDGLDEAPGEHQSACVVAINRIIDSAAIPGIVVTSRLEEYRVMQSRLHVNMAVRLHLLTTEAVSEYFRKHPVLSRVADVWLDGLTDLARSPLALSLLAHVATTSLRAAPGAELAEQRGQLIDGYIRCMMSRTGKKKLGQAHEQFVASLQQLARVMRQQHCPVLQLDALQPDWLSHAASRRAYALASRSIAAAVFGCGLILSFGKSPLDNMGFRASLLFGVELALATMVTTGLLCGAHVSLKMRRPRNAGPGRPRYRVQLVMLCAAAGVVNAAILGWLAQHAAAAIMGAEAAIAAVLVLSPHPGIGDPRNDIRPRESSRVSLTHALRGLPFVAVLSFVALAISVCVNGWYAGIVSGVYVFAFGLLLNAVRGTQVDEHASPTGAIQRSLRFAQRIAIAGAVVHFASVPMLFGAAYAACSAVTTLLILWLWYGGYPAIQYFTLRILLRLEGQGFYDERYLDAAVDRGLLYRVGAGYMFPHPLFIEHLASRGGSGRGGA